MIESTKNLTVDHNLPQATSYDGGQLNATYAKDAFPLATKCERSKSLRLAVGLSLLILMLAFGVQSASAQTTWSLGYYFPAAVPAPLSAIEWSALTHVAMVGGNPNSDASITLSANFSAQAPALISAAHANGVKVLYSLTDLGIGGTGWVGAASGSCSSGNLRTFAGNIMSTVNSYGFDGVDLDWEETFNSTEISNLLSCLRSNLGTKLLSADNVSVPSCATPGASLRLQ